MKIDIDFEEFFGERLISVRGFGRNISQEGRVSYYFLIFEFISASLLFKANKDTDEIIVQRRHVMKFRNWDNVPETKHLLKFKTLRCWMSYSHNGSCDMFVFAFPSMEPALALYVMASQIGIYEIKASCASENA